MTLATFAAAASAAGALSQGFTSADTSLNPGTLVIQQDSKTNVVKKATSDHAQQLIGVVANKPLVALASGAQQIQVVTSGSTPVLVSDINGDIKIGDKITASPVEGVGMKARTPSEIVGTAASNLADSHTVTQAVTDTAGKHTDIHVGVINAQINVSYYAPPQSKLDAVVPSFLVNLGSSIAGKDLSPLRVLIGFSGLLAGFLIVGIMLQAGIRSGIISLGRNPLAHNFLRRGLLDVMVTSVAVLVITVIAFYLILTL